MVGVPDEAAVWPIGPETRDHVARPVMLCPPQSTRLKAWPHLHRCGPAGATNTPPIMKLGHENGADHDPEVMIAHAAGGRDGR